VPNPSNAINAKDQRKLEVCAIKPIIGGPIKKPKKLIEDTIASATPGSIFFDLPARLYTIGTTDDTPIPTNKNPSVAVTIFGNKTETMSPVKMEMVNFMSHVSRWMEFPSAGSRRPNGGRDGGAQFAC